MGIQEAGHGRRRHEDDGDGRGFSRAGRGNVDHLHRSPGSLKTKKEVPFGVFLALGAAITFLFADILVEQYRTLFL
ncbi:MAG: hypothetical protein P8125_10955 [Gemmatimonadota bacterium]